MANILALDSLDIYSPGKIRITNCMKHIIKFSDQESKLFSWFTYDREDAVGESKALWDRIFKLLVNRELLRFHVAQDMVARLRERLDSDIDKYRGQYAGLGTDLAPQLVQTFQHELRKASRIHEYVLYVEMHRTAHAELLTLGTVMDTIWGHQEKTLDDNAILTKADQRDRHVDFAKYMVSRAKYLQILDNQLKLKASLEDPVTMAAMVTMGWREARQTSEREAMEKQVAKQAKKRQYEKARKQRKKAEADVNGQDENEEKPRDTNPEDHDSK